MEILLQDIRFSIRMLLKKPGFTVIAVIALALGIGANSAIFSVINAVLLRPLPYKAPEQLVWIWETNPTSDIKQEPASPPNFADWKSQNQSFDSMTAYATSTPILAGGGEPERIPGVAVTEGFFSVLGVDAMLGRTFLPEEDKQGNHRVAILSHALWQRRFGADPNIVDQTITLNGNPYVVVGVMPPAFQTVRTADGLSAQIWTPLPLNYAQAARRGDFLSVIARLKPSVSIEQARSEMASITHGLEEQYPQTNTGWGVTIIPLHEKFVGDVRPALVILLGAVCFLLLIACANVANLLLARAATRQKEISLRTALGASRGRIVRQLLTESMLLAVIGGALGLLLAFWGIKVLIALSPENIPRLNEVGLDARVLGFTFAVSVLTGVVFGLLPALQASKPNLNESLKEGGRSSAGGIRSGRLRNLLAVAEVALALVLLVGAGLLVKSFMRLQQVNPGFNPERVLTMELLLPSSKYKEGAQVTGFYNQLLTMIQSLPGVESAGAVSTLPLAGTGSIIAFDIEGRPQRQPSDNTPDAEYRVISADYFRTMGIPLKRGRLFTEQDVPEAPRALIISETMARQHWPNEDPIGKRINTGDPQTTPWRTVVGIVGDIKNQGLETEPYAQMYAPYTQYPQQSLALVVRTASDPVGFASTIRSQVWEIDRDLPLYKIRTMEQILSASIARPRFNMFLIVIFAAVALVLASVGIYGVISYSVTQRTHEIGVRMALGAQRGDVLRLIVGQGMALALAGVSVGLLASFALTRVMSSLLYGVSATDPITFAAISILLTGVALLACFIPAHRATKVDPMIALRYE